MAKNRSSHVAKPVYPGGLEAMKKFLAQHLKYPAPALQAKVEGTVVVRYSLDYRGKVVATKVKKGLGHGCDEEARRVVSLLRFEVPQDRKKKVRIHQDINIHFRSPKAKKQTESPGAVTTSITYTTVPAAKIAGGKKPKPNLGYTIKW